MKTSYVERAKHFINEIATTIPSRPSKSDIEQAITNYCLAHPRRKILCDSGCARTAIISSDYVVKMDTGNSATYGGCADEEEIYELAKSEGMEHVLAEITSYFANGKTFYIYPRAKVLANTKKHMDEWVRGFTYNEYNFIQQTIDDLYEGNVGYLNGKSIVIDYAARRTKI